MAEKYVIECKTEDDSRQLFQILLDVKEGRAKLSTVRFDGMRTTIFIEEVT